MSAKVYDKFVVLMSAVGWVCDDCKDTVRSVHQQIKAATASLAKQLAEVKSNVEEGTLKMREMKIRDMNIRENEYAGQTYAKSNVYTMKLIKFKLNSGVFMGRATVRWPPL